MADAQAVTLTWTHLSTSNQAAYLTDVTGTTGVTIDSHYTGPENIQYSIDLDATASVDIAKMVSDNSLN